MESVEENYESEISCNKCKNKFKENQESEECDICLDSFCESCGKDQLKTQKEQTICCSCAEITPTCKECTLYISNDMRARCTACRTQRICNSCVKVCLVCDSSFCGACQDKELVYHQGSQLVCKECLKEPPCADCGKYSNYYCSCKRCKKQFCESCVWRPRLSAISYCKQEGCYIPEPTPYEKVEFGFDDAVGRKLTGGFKHPYTDEWYDALMMKSISEGICGSTSSFNCDPRPEYCMCALNTYNQIVDNPECIICSIIKTKKRLTSENVDIAKARQELQPFYVKHIFRVLNIR